MKKILIILAIILCIPFTANALEINSLGIKSKDLDNMTIYTREDTNQLYFYYQHNIYAMGENDSYKMYLRCIKNPLDKDYTADADLIDDVFGLIENTNTNSYAYVTSGDYKYIKFVYNTKDSNIPLIEYYIAWKDIFVTITFESKNTEFTVNEMEEINNFVKSITFTGKGQAEISHVYEEGLDYEPKKTGNGLIIEVIICAAAIGIAYFITRKKK